MDETDNRRSFARAPLSNSAAYLSVHRLLIARVGDVSAGGAFLGTTHPDPVGTRATLEVFGESLDVEVVRVCFDGARAGMGVSFVDVPRAVRRRIAGPAERVTDAPGRSDA